MVQALPQGNSLEPGQISISVDFPAGDKADETIRLVKLALRTRFFTFDDRDDVRVEPSGKQMLRATITATHDSLKPPGAENQ
jgi:hypothetical protein